MISKSSIKQIRGLERKKNRLEERLFVAEGPKLVGELLATMRPKYVAATEEWLEANRKELSGIEVDLVSEGELQRASLLQHPQSVVALFPFPHWEARLADVAAQELCLALDGVQDPGNLGTIVRIADWFGIRHIFCSPDTADIFNPKATQATMGALARVQVHYIDLIAELSALHKGGQEGWGREYSSPTGGGQEGWGGEYSSPTGGGQEGAPIYGTFLDGANIYEQQLSHNGIIIMGNEGRGIRKETAALVSHRLLIPSYPADRTTVESLNVAIATAIICAEFRRRA